MSQWKHPTRVQGKIHCGGCGQVFRNTWAVSSLTNKLLSQRTQQRLLSYVLVCMCEPCNWLLLATAGYCCILRNSHHQMYSKNLLQWSNHIFLIRPQPPNPTLARIQCEYVNVINTSHGQSRMLTCTERGRQNVRRTTPTCTNWLGTDTKTHSHTPASPSPPTHIHTPASGHY